MMCSRCKKRMAVVFITRMEGDKSYNEGLCLVCAKELGIKPVNDLMDKMGVSDSDIENLSEQMTDMIGAVGDPDDENFEPGGAATYPFLQNLFGAQPEPEEENLEHVVGEVDGEEGPASKRGRRSKEKNGKKRKYLDMYCTNLTEKAKRGELDAIIGRDQQIYRVIQILSRRTKNNPCLIGEPGVGKTAIAEGLALRIAAGDVPMRLAKKEIHLLDLTALVAGTQFRGQFESRIKGLIDEVKADGNVILFIDEVHNLVGTGDAEGSMNAANILKPALSRGEIQVIGATTFTEYRKYIEKDSALERRFQPVTVEEPSMKETVEMLKGIKHYYEAYHRVSIPDSLLSTAVSLSERYITDRFLPDKAIDLLDEACAHASLRNTVILEYDKAMERVKELSEREETMAEDPEFTDYETLASVRAEIAQLQTKIDELAPTALSNAVTKGDLAKVVELWTGIPAARVEQSELKRLAHLEEALGKKIIGQPEAVAAVAAAVRRSRVQISTRRRPASFIFVGPTGVGKTELVKVLAAELFDTPETLIRLDMSEFMEKHSVSRIIGSPPGYVGYDEAGQLTEKVRRKPYSVLLFDEIEKAHPDVMNILLQILDEGKVTDAHGRTVNFENTVIVMTSNAGSRDTNALGFAKSAYDASRDRALKALSDFLRPEFMSRVDEIVVFRPLDAEDLKKIADLMLGDLKEAVDEKGISISWDKEVTALLAKLAGHGKHGARDLRSIIRREVEDRIATILVNQCDNPPTALKLQAEEEHVSVTAESGGDSL